MTVVGIQEETPLRRVIREKGIKQKWLADRIGVPYSRMSDWARGVAPLDPAYIPAIARELKVRQKDIRP